MTVPALAAIAIVLLIGVSRDATGQDVRSSAAECRRCVVERRAVAVLGRDRDAQEAAPIGVAGAIGLPGGQLLAIGLRAQGGPLVFAADGRFLRPIGRAGRGPGEYVGASAVLPWRGDSILVVDPPLGRVSVLSPVLGYVRSFPLPVPSVESAVPLASGRIVLNTAIGDGQRDPMRIVDPGGNQVGSFGRSTTPDDGRALGNALRLLATDGRTVWSAAPFGGYVLEEWDSETSRPGRRLIREAPFVRSGGSGSPTPERPPRSTLTGMYLEQDRLWVLMAVAGDRWARGLARTPVRGEGGALQYRIDDPHLVYDTIVDVFDIRTGRLLASRRFDEFIGAISSSGRMATIQRESREGNLLTELVRFDLVQR